MVAQQEGRMKIPRRRDGDIINGSQMIMVNREEFENAKYISESISSTMDHPIARRMLLQAVKLANPHREIPELNEPPTEYVRLGASGSLPPT